VELQKVPEKLDFSRPDLVNDERRGEEAVQKDFGVEFDNKQDICERELEEA
jgi:hypothetical protein